MTNESSDFILSADDLRTVEEYRLRQRTAILVVMFVDVKESTATRERLGEVPFEIERSGADGAMRASVAAHRGQTIKGTGDGFLAVFSQADDAVDCACDIQAAMPLQSPLSLRIGLDMGQVADQQVGTSRDVFGRHVNRAARIEHLAEAGHIVVSYPVWDSAKGWLAHRSDIRWKAHGAYELSGFDDVPELFEPYRPPVYPSDALRGKTKGRTSADEPAMMAAYLEALLGKPEVTLLPFPEVGGGVRFEALYVDQTLVEEREEKRPAPSPAISASELRVSPVFDGVLFAHFDGM